MLDTATAGTPTVTMETYQNLTTTPPGESPGWDKMFIVAMACCAVGGVLLTAGFIRLGVWIHRLRHEDTSKRRQIKHFQHMRYLEEYAIRTGGSNNQIPHKQQQQDGGSLPRQGTTSGGKNNLLLNWDEYGLNRGYVGEDTIERLGVKGPMLDAHITGSTSGLQTHVHLNRQSTSSEKSVRHHSNGSVPNGSLPRNTLILTNGSLTGNGALPSNGALHIGALPSNGVLPSNGALHSNGALPSNSELHSNGALPGNGSLSRNSALPSSGALHSNGAWPSDCGPSVSVVEVNGGVTVVDVVDSGPESPNTSASTEIMVLSDNDSVRSGGSSPRCADVVF